MCVAWIGREWKAEKLRSRDRKMDRYKGNVAYVRRRCMGLIDIHNKESWH